jgi:hypothetical protein
MKAFLLLIAFHYLSLFNETNAAGPDVRPTADLLRDIRAAGPQGSGSASARTAWDQLVTRGPEVLPQILAAMDTDDVVASNWLRTAFDTLAERELKAGGQKLPVEDLLAFVQDSRRQGRARRLALDLLEQVKPGTRDRLAEGWLNDPEFRYEAVALATSRAEAIEKNGQKEPAIAAYRTAFQAARETGQVKSLAARLQGLGTQVDVLEHMGFFHTWYLLGPFDGKNMTSFRTVHPPEEKIDLSAEYAGKNGKIAWKKLDTTAQERIIGMINLLKAVAETDDAVAYAYTAFEAPASREVEFRGGADDHFTVWVNGRKVFGLEEYRNGVRLDRHRFKVKLNQGVNTVLVKIGQATIDPTNPEMNWEFVLRMVDATGKGFGFRSVLPNKEKN